MSRLGRYRTMTLQARARLSFDTATPPICGAIRRGVRSLVPIGIHDLPHVSHRRLIRQPDEMMSTKSIAVDAGKTVTTARDHDQSLHPHRRRVVLY